MPLLATKRCNQPSKLKVRSRICFKRQKEYIIVSALQGLELLGGKSLEKKNRKRITEEKFSQPTVIILI